MMYWCQELSLASEWNRFPTLRDNFELVQFGMSDKFKELHITLVYV